MSSVSPSLNILVTENGRAKLTDFGLSTVKKATHASTTTPAGTLLWMAPELFKPSGKHSKASDVYSYGIVLSELATRKVPYEDSDASNQAVVVQWIKEGEHDEIPNDCPAAVKQIMTCCWSLQPEQRPQLPEVIEELKKVSLDGNKLDYPDNLQSLASNVQAKK